SRSSIQMTDDRPVRWADRACFRVPIDIGVRHTEPTIPWDDYRGRGSRIPCGHGISFSLGGNLRSSGVMTHDAGLINVFVAWREHCPKIINLCSSAVKNF